MRVLPVFALISSLFALPDLRVDWVGQSRSEVRVTLEGKDDQAEQCLESGLEVRYRFRVQVCHPRVGWIDDCAPERVFSRSLSFEPVSERYKLTSDQFGDQQDPVTLMTTSRDEALRLAGSLDNTSLGWLGIDTRDPKWSERRVTLSARVTSQCKGEYNQAIAKLSYFLTLGLLRIDGYDSGWRAFVLRGE